MSGSTASGSTGTRGGVSFALKPGKFHDGATAKTPPSAAKLPSIPAHAGTGVELPFAEQNGPQMAHSLLRWIARSSQAIDYQHSQHPDSNRVKARVRAEK